MKLNGFDTSRQVMVIAEIGNNHEGELSVAREMMQAAAEAGADAVKFQTFQTEHFVNPQDAERVERMSRFELTPGEFERLAEEAAALGVRFISTPFDLPSVDVLEPIVDAYKIASADNNFYPLLEKCCNTGRPMIVSSGISDLDQLRNTKAFIERNWRSRKTIGELAILHCVSNYPTADADANLRAMTTLAGLDCEIGYSDHTLGIEACCLSVALGARIVEKHFTLDKNYSDFRDHAIASEPAELRELVQRIRQSEALLGSGAKQIAPCEQGMVSAIRRSIVAKRDLKAGHQLALADLTWMRPGEGLEPGREEELIGGVLRQAMKRGQAILLEDVQSCQASRDVA